MRLLAAFLLCASCATPYQASGFSGGYRDFVVRPGLYSISVTGNGYTGQATLREYWHRRARELCGGDYDFTEAATTTAHLMKTTTTTAVVNKHEVSGYAECLKNNAPAP
jgi:hypothetical protein